MTYYATKYLYPVRRPFPIWRFGRLYRGWGWYPDWYETREVGREEADRLRALAVKEMGMA